MKNHWHLTLIFFVSVVYANDNVSHTLGLRLNAIHTLSAKFKQTVRHDERIVERSQGTFSLVKPGKFRWVIDTPSPQLIVSDGNILWIFDKELEQATKQMLSKGIGSTPALFLSNYDNALGKKYRINLSLQKGNEIYTLHPIAETNYRFIELTFNKEYLQGIKVEDQLGQITRLEFYQETINQPMSNKLFQFTPPPGVDVVSQ